MVILSLINISEMTTLVVMINILNTHPSHITPSHIQPTIKTIGKIMIASSNMFDRINNQHIKVERNIMASIPLSSNTLIINDTSYHPLENPCLCNFSNRCTSIKPNGARSSMMLEDFPFINMVEISNSNNMGINRNSIAISLNISMVVNPSSSMAINRSSNMAINRSNSMEISRMVVEVARTIVIVVVDDDV